MFDWNDLKYLVAVARHQSTTAASRALGVNQSTVQRRLVELERCMGQALVHRHPSGYRLTAFGEQVLPLAQRVEQAVVALTQHVDVFRREVTGVVRMTCPEPLVYRISNSTLLERFHTRYPGLHVEFVTSDQYLTLTPQIRAAEERTSSTRLCTLRPRPHPGGAPPQPNL
jgi:DNA-binding transcriptional LysR family regulator